MLNAFYIIDKPINITSFFALKILRKKLDLFHVGHGGTLDPIATGILIVATGEYTKLLPYIENLEKTYEVTIALDGDSESHDTETEITYISEQKKDEIKNNLDISKLQDIIDRYFSGTIMQTPPKHSAVWVDGKRAYELAREGKEFDLKAKEIEIHDLKIKSYNYPDLVLELNVSKGTYIRSIARDIGEIIGTGGYIKALRRTKVGNVDISIAQDIDDNSGLKQANLEKIFGKNKILTLNDAQNSKLYFGNEFRYEGLEDEDIYFVKRDDGLITNVVQYMDSFIKPIRRLNV